MSKPLRLFIQPPYDAAPAGPWSLVHGYGPEVPEPAAGPAIHGHALLQTTGTAAFYAAADGRLSARPPGGGGLDPEEEITVPDPGEPRPATVNLYLHLTPGVRANPAFRTRSLQINEIQGFAYLNVETASLEAGLAELLDQAVLPWGGLTRSQVVDLLVWGLLDVSVTAGHAVGCGSTEGAPAGSRQLGFTVLTQAGPLDPAHTYDWMRDYVGDGQPALDAFLALVPKRWPVIGSGIAIADALALTAAALYPMAVLEELRTTHSLTALQWRQVGDNQKALWRLRLLARVGHAAGATDPPFEFDDVDWQNIFQLEALAEFYANFDDPWAAGAAPRAPGGVLQGAAATAAAAVVTLDGAPNLSTIRVNHDLIYLATDTARPSRTYRILEVTGASSVRLDAAPALSGGTSAWRLDLYQTVNFLDPEGTAATAVGNVVTLDGTADLTRVWVGKDEIKFESDANTARPSKRYRITAMNVAARTVTIDQPPNLVGPSAWRITLRPTTVLIEPFGGRLKGTNAAVVSGSPNKLKLDGLPASSKINKHFDTIYLPGDTARTSRTYRITAVDDATDQVTLDGSPSLTGGASWHLPAGVSGELPALSYKLGVDTAKGWDHYDGVLFVVYQGAVHSKYRWTSFTSHNYAVSTPPHQSRSSLRGNRRYHFASLRSPGSSFINYAFKVYDHDASYDGVREARWYFEATCTEDRAVATADPGTNGKKVLRFHDGNLNSTGTGSAGCLVSPSFYHFRDALITLYQAELGRFDGSSDAEVNKALGLGRAASKTLYLKPTTSPDSLAEANWNDKMAGTLWVIRPDERPL